VRIKKDDMTLGRDASLCSALLLGGVLLASLPTQGQASANVGCLFTEQVCAEDEVCFDDLVIGRCISAAGDDEQFIRLGPLSGPPLDLLSAELRRVFSQGYTWEDDYSQCVFQTLLDHIQHKGFYSAEECAHLARDGGFQPLHLKQNQGDLLHPDIYPQEDLLERENYPQQDNFLDNDVLMDVNPGLYDADVIRPDLDYEENFVLPDDETEDGEDLVLVPSDNLLLGGERSASNLLLGGERSPFPAEAKISLPEILPFADPAPNQDDFPPTMDDFPATMDDFPGPPDDYPPRSDDLYQPLPEIIPLFVPLEDGDAPNQVPEILPEDDFYTTFQDIRQLKPDARNMPKLRTKRPSTDWVVVDQQDADDDFSTDDFDYNDESAAAMDQENDDTDAIYYAEEPRLPVETIFDRRERLDVKKPGPFFANSQNNFFLNKLLTLEGEEGEQNLEKDLGQTEYEMPLTMQSKQKKAFRVKVGDEGRLLGYEDTPTEESRLIVNIKDRFKTLGQANSVVEAIANVLQVPIQTFGEPTLWTSRLSIPVQSNPRRLNASSMAQILGSQINSVNKRMDSQQDGVKVQNFSTGTEDEVVSVFTGHSRLFLALFLLTAGLASVMLVGALVLILRRRRVKKVECKDDKEAKEEPVKEYKQLVRDWSRSSRASQSSGPPTTAAAEDGAKGRSASEDGPKKQPLSGVAGKHHNSEGSRTSSTSSWQEDPGVSTMDISTGHMVLAYMEDHLNNKQRLEQEWVGLCAYEAEPAATSVAFKVENKKKNRYPDKLPYDHNRVLLNALVNGNNSDYINASTVTDHDPRNPAYIVTQGPMSHTIADFWQMVWEQGSVVIVMLSRLAENGYQLAHRYWPEEGSNQYHIYEVHLVSEHVWCEDYLVRSLYLKNTQTGETRTVTQFHFLSWADGCTPSSTKSLLEFRRKVNKSYRGRSCPIIVHCSDGVGRSGTYVLIDMVLNRMNKGSKEIDIAATLEHIRDQRSGMVQTRSQFEFCLTSVAEETHAILKSLAQ